MPNTALLVIDIQRGAFDGARCDPIDQPNALVASALSLLSAARSSGTPIVFVQHCEGAGAPFEEGSIHGEIHEALAPQPGEAVLRKHASSAFEGTNLGALLADMNARELVLCGLQSEFCVANTARAALANGFAVTIAEDGHSTWPSEGEPADAIKARVNAELAQAGARLRPVADLERSFT